MTTEKKKCDKQRRSRFYKNSCKVCGGDHFRHRSRHHNHVGTIGAMLATFTRVYDQKTK